MDRFVISIGGYRVTAATGELPEMYELYRANALVVEEFDLASPDGDSCVFTVREGHRAWPELVVSQRYDPSGYGFPPGLLIVPETAVVFIGAGTRLLAYRMSPQPHRLWEDRAHIGFWRWEAYEGTVLMSAEMELAAWTSNGEKLWTTGVDPPWHYQVHAGSLTVNVIGEERTFPLIAGPQDTSGT